MKKFVAITAASVVVFALLRHFGPALRDRAMARCQEMMARHQGDVGAGPSDPSVALKDPATPAAA